MSTKKKIVILLSIFIVFVTTLWVFTTNQKNRNHTEQQVMQDNMKLENRITDKLTQLEISLAKNKGFWNDNEIEITKIRAAAFALKQSAPRQFQSRIKKLIEQCNEQL